jgi:hypothetical protein
MAIEMVADSLVRGVALDDTNPIKYHASMDREMKLCVYLFDPTTQRVAEAAAEYRKVIDYFKAHEKEFNAAVAICCEALILGQKAQKIEREVSGEAKYMKESAADLLALNSCSCALK